MIINHIVSRINASAWFSDPPGSNHAKTPSRNNQKKLAWLVIASFSKSLKLFNDITNILAGHIIDDLTVPLSIVCQAVPPKPKEKKQQQKRNNY